ncbi:hypothetical protein ACLEPN_29675 [Myxococcus sp. 1LA]
MPRHDASKTTPDRRRTPKGDVARRVEVGLTARGLAAREYLVAHLARQPQEGVPANGNGATNLALEEAAHADGVPPARVQRVALLVDESLAEFDAPTTPVDVHGPVPEDWHAAT